MMEKAAKVSAAWDRPAAEAPPVKILATWTLAEAVAGGTPKASSTVLAMTP